MDNILGFLSSNIGRRMSFSWELGRKRRYLIWYARMPSFENLSAKCGWTLNFDSFLSKHDFCSSMICYNSLVRIANRPIFCKHWAEAGIKNIKDLVNDDLTVITCRDFREKYCLSASFLDFYGVTSALRSAPINVKSILY